VELKEVIGRRRSIRFFQPYRPVEREKVQKILEAERLASCAVNATYVRAIVVNRDAIPPEALERLATPVSATNFTLAPTYIFFFGDSSRPLRNRGEILHQLIDAGALGPSHGWSHASVEHHVYPNVIEAVLESPERRLRIMAFDCGVAACQALLMAVDEGLGASFAGFNAPAVKALLDVPEDWLPMYALLLGYPAESWEAGGQRPRPPFEEIFFEGKHGMPFRPDPAVTEELKAARMIQRPAPLPWRKAELRALSRMLGLPE
jgi:nitroreductase